MNHFYCVFAVLLLTLSSCYCRPQTTIDSQQPDGSLSAELDQAPSHGWSKLYSGFEPSAVQRYQSLIEEAKQQQPVSPLERLQMEFLSRLAQQQNSIGGGGSGLPWEPPMYRMPEMKRQVRYRQCYFNPISCFKK